MTQPKFASRMEIMMKDDDQFQLWLMDMDQAIERFLRSIPSITAGKLDYSQDSLDAIERFVLDRYPTIADVKQQKEANVVDGMARYIGQTFRKHLGGKWGLELADKTNAFYGIPQLVGMAGQRTQLCPLTLVTASSDRRTGRFIRTVFDNFQRNAANARPAH